jgi:C-3',4' desaturase CrtD
MPKKTVIEMGKSVCVIGAGIGGLTAGAYLAREGYGVTVIEKASTPGGSAGWYVRKNRRFPTGATIAFGLEENGLFKSLLEELQMDLAVTELTHPMDVVLSDRTVSIYKDAGLWEEELKQKFPDRSHDIVRFWKELTKISTAVYGVTSQRACLPVQRWYDLGKLPNYAAAQPGSILLLARYVRWTVEDLLRQYKLEHHQPFRSLLNAQLMDAVQTDVSEAALLPSSLALAIYRRGSFHLEKGIGQLSSRLTDRIAEQGGEIVLSSPVQYIHYDEKSLRWQVESKKHTAAFDVVINNTGISFGEGTSHGGKDEYSWGAFRLDAIVHKQVWKQSLQSRPLPFSFQIVPSPIHGQLFGDEHGPVYVTFHETMDGRGQLVEEEMTMTASIHTDPKKWLAYSKQEYKEKKAEVLAAILLEIEKVIPVNKHLLYAEAGTPVTYQKFIGKTGVGGFPLTVKNAMIKPKSIRTKLPNFYIAGEQAFPGPGTLSSALSGYFTARAIIKG